MYKRVNGKWTNDDYSKSKTVRLYPETLEVIEGYRGKNFSEYEWVLQNYAQPGDRIIDTHAGSGSSLVACHRMRFDFLGFEIEKDYFLKADERIKAEQAQISIFDFL